LIEGSTEKAKASVTINGSVEMSESTVKIIHGLVNTIKYCVKTVKEHMVPILGSVKLTKVPQNRLIKGSLRTTEVSLSVKTIEGSVKTIDGSVEVIEGSI